MDDDTVQLVDERCAYLFGIGCNGIERYVNIAVHACARGIIKGDDVGIVVVLKELTIDGENLLVVAEDIVEVAHRITVLCSSALNPLLDFADVNGRHENIVSVEGDHVWCLVNAASRYCLVLSVECLVWLTEEDASDGECGNDAKKVRNQAARNRVAGVFDTDTAKIHSQHIESGVCSALQYTT